MTLCNFNATVYSLKLRVSRCRLLVGERIIDITDHDKQNTVIHRLGNAGPLLSATACLCEHHKTAESLLTDHINIFAWILLHKGNRFILVLMQNMARARCLAGSLLLLLSSVATQGTGSLEISYVLEPFDAVYTTSESEGHVAVFDNPLSSVANVGDTKTRTCLSSSPYIEVVALSKEDKASRVNHDPPLFGLGALKVLVPEEGITFGTILNGTRWAAHNCIGATHVSLWYKLALGNKAAVAGRTLSLSLYDDQDCTSCDDKDDLETFTSVRPVAIVANDGNSTQEIWHEIRFSFAGNSETQSDFSSELNLGHMRGWSISVSAPDTSSGDPLTLLVDQLACVGGGDLLGAAFRNHDTFETALATKAWQEQYYDSELSENETKAELTNNNFLSIDYTIEQREPWGGFVSYKHVAPLNAYYNLSNADNVALSYAVTRAESPSDRAHFRVILYEASGCDRDCENVKNHESYYSFQYVLSEERALTNFSVELQGNNKDMQSPFWLTGWSGTLRDGVFDRAHIKGVVFELSMNGDGEIGSLVSGSLEIGNFTAASHESLNEEDLVCVEEPGLFVSYASLKFKRIFFQNDEQCCRRCELDADCLYAISDESNCLIASELDADSLELADTAPTLAGRFFSKTTNVLGDFCQLCECRRQDLTIDCRGRNLTVVPKTFSPPGSDMPWAPRVLDLRENPFLYFVATGALVAITVSLEELRLPKGLQYLAPEVVRSGPPSVIFESSQQDALGHIPLDGHALINAIIGKDDFFGNVCCAPGEHVSATVPASGFTFCNMEVDTIGGDCSYEPFVNLFNGITRYTITPSSDFLSEAAQSVEKCAEYCKIMKDCRFFEFDQRILEAEHQCNLLATDGVPTEICCDTPDFADAELTLPGYTSGRPPRTRYELDSARVVFVPVSSTANKENSFTAQYKVSLGSSPLRGAVWVEPKLASKSTLKVSIIPPRVALYDNMTTAIISVIVRNADALEGNSETLVLVNSIESCDTAFTSFDDASDNNIFINVVGAPEEQALVTALIVSFVGLVLFSALLFYFLHERKKQQSDAIWQIKSSDLHFGNPPEVLGQGTFGLVHMAEYRGTQVAVKRVLPPSGSFERAETHSASSDVTKVTIGRDLESGAESEEAGHESGRNPVVKNAGLHTLPICTSSGSLKKNRNLRLLWSESKRMKANFVSEMRMISKLRHPCVTTVMGAIVSKNEEPMLVLEYMQYGSLYDLLHNDTVQVEGELLLPILRDVAQGMRFLHASTPQIIHGDIKAANILVDNKFRGKVADFGLTQKRQMGATGTPFWMSPELLRGETSNTPESDVYSFGIVLFEMYSREDPYGDELDECHTILNLIADPAVNKRPPVPEACPPTPAALMKACLSPDASKRPTFEALDQKLKDLDATMIEPSTVQKTMQDRMDRTEGLLADVFPKHIAEALREGKKIEPESRDIVTIFYSEIEYFDAFSSILSPLKISDVIGRLYTAFDELSKIYDVYKLETVGDSYMVVTNLVKDQPDHVKRIAEFAVDAVAAAKNTLMDLEDPDLGYVNIRCGFHSGAAVANVVGNVSPRYCLFGNVVNVSRVMEMGSEENRIHCSERSAKLLKAQCPNMPLHARGPIKVKGIKGKVVTYWVNETPLVSLVDGMGSVRSLSTEGSASRAHSKRRSKQKNLGLRPSAIPEEVVCTTNTPVLPPPTPSSPRPRSARKFATGLRGGIA